MAAMLKNDMR